MRGAPEEKSGIHGLVGNAAFKPGIGGSVCPMGTMTRMICNTDSQ